MDTFSHFIASQREWDEDDIEDVEKEPELEEDIISYSFENNGDVVSISCIDRDMFVITENDYEVALTDKQMDFIVNMYDMIIDYLDRTKPRK